MITSLFVCFFFVFRLKQHCDIRLLYSYAGLAYTYLQYDITNARETKILNGADVITDEGGYQMCIQKDGTSYIVKAAQIVDDEIVDGTTITMTGNGVWGE